MKPFKEKEKRKKIGHDVFEEIMDFIFEGIFGLLWRLVAGFFHLLGRLIGSIFHNFF